jgi:hypothetical protein
VRAQARTLLLALALVGGLAGCARAISVGSEASPVYRLTVANDMPEAMIVSYNDGRGDRMLGSVPAGRSDAFVVSGAASTDITISARNAQGTRAFGPVPVRLVLGDVVTVRLRP